MPDNSTMGGTDVIATDDLTSLNGGAVTGVKAQRVKVGFGVDGSFTDVTSAAPMPVSMLANALVSTTNSSTVALAANGIFTGAAEDVSDYSSIKIAVFANQASATDGVQLQQSTDGTNWDFMDAFTVAASTGKTLGAPVQAKFFRVVYTNGATANTVFRLQTIYGKNVKLSGAQRPSDARSNENDFEEMLAYGVAFNGTSWDRIRSSAKAVQATSALAVQDLKDSGRVNVSITCYRAAGIPTTEALFAAGAFSMTRDGAAATTGNSFTVSAGKRFRLQVVECSLFGNAALAVTSKLALRYNGAGGAITNTSPILAIWDIGSNSTATANYIGPVVWSVPDGTELPPGATFGFTNLASAATVLHTITATGFEY